MAKLGKHIQHQGFDSELNIDLDYKVFPDSFVLSGVVGNTTFGSNPTDSDFYYDVSSIEKWEEVKLILDFDCKLVRDAIDLLYQSQGGYASYSGFTQLVKEALSKNFLIDKVDRDLLFSESEQDLHAKELLISINKSHTNNILNASINYITASGNVDIGTFISNSCNFIGDVGGNDAVTSINGDSGIVILGVDDLSGVNIGPLGNNDILKYDGTSWVNSNRPELKVHSKSQNFLNYNTSTGELFLENLATTNVIKNTTDIDSVAYLNSPKCCDNLTASDIIIFENIP